MQPEASILAALLAAGAAMAGPHRDRRLLARRLAIRRRLKRSQLRSARAVATWSSAGPGIVAALRNRPESLIALLGGGLAATWAGPAAGVVATLAMGAAMRSRRRTRAESVVALRRSQVVEACLALAAELRAGQPPATALANAAPAAPDVLEVPARRAVLGGDVAAALRDGARAPGARGLDSVAAGWEVCMHAGAGLSDVLSRVAVALQADLAARAESEAQLASAKATARLLALLPIFTLLIASGLGGRPLHFLTGTPVGVACLFTGALLAWTGVTWVDRLARSAVD